MSKPVAVLVFDLETTSVEIDKAGIVEIGAVFVDPDWNTYPIFSSLSWPRVELGDSHEIHGITEEELQYAPSEAWVLYQFVSTIRALEQSYELVISGYNQSGYDVPIVELQYPGLLSSKPSVDMMHVITRYYPQHSGKLGEAYVGMTEKQPVNAHRATADCLMVAEMLEMLCKENLWTPLEVAKAMQEPQLYKMWPFGKHKGKPLESVPRGYAHWCLKNFDHLSLDLEFSLQAVVRGDV